MLIPPKIPPNIDANWYQFVTEWCLDVEPEESPSEVQRAFDALRRFWPEVVEDLEIHRDAAPAVRLEECQDDGTYPSGAAVTLTGALPSAGRRLAH